MKTILHIFGSDGKETLSRDLTDVTTGLKVSVGAADGIAVSEELAEGRSLLAALLPVEDGWMLASPDPERPIRSGAKSVSDIVLAGGMVCSLGDWSFSLETEVASTESEILWRYAGSAPAVDHVLRGRNVFAVRADGKPEVNPPMVERVAFEFYPTAEGLEVTLPGNAAERLPVGPNTLFSVGAFEGMLMSPADAAKAVRSSSPFAFPSRGIRVRMLASAIGLGLLALVGVWFLRRANDLGEEAARRPGPVEIALSHSVASVTNYEELVVYNQSFYQSMPAVLKAEPGLETDDLVLRGELLVAFPGVKEKIKFLDDVKSIQIAIKSGRWDELAKCLSAVDRKAFGEYEASGFLRQAEQVSRLVTQLLPQRLADAVKAGEKGAFDAILAELNRQFAEMKGNVFMTDSVLNREYGVSSQRIGAALAYTEARQTVESAAKGERFVGTSEQVDDLCGAYAELVESLPDDDALFRAMRTSEAKRVAKLAERVAGCVLQEFKADSQAQAAALKLEPLSRLAEQAGVPEDRIAAWRQCAKEASQRLATTYRTLYSQYRTQSYSDRAAAAATLERILAIGDTGNSFHRWAVREKERIGGGAK